MTSGVARHHVDDLLGLPHRRIRYLLGGLRAKTVEAVSVMFASTDPARPRRQRRPAHRERFIEDAAMAREMYRL